MNRTLPTDSQARKDIPVLSGPVHYFPAALAGVAKICKAGNDKHNPGQPLHHARGKSMDHGDCIVRHLMDIADIEADFSRRPQTPTEREIDELMEEANQMSWRSMALNQLLHEKYGRAPMAPGAKLLGSNNMQVLAGSNKVSLSGVAGNLLAVDPVRPEHFAERSIYAPKKQVPDADGGFVKDGPLEVGDLPYGNGQ